jgi:Carboxypeptidase regulatory-like domain
MNRSLETRELRPRDWLTRCPLRLQLNQSSRFQHFLEVLVSNTRFRNFVTCSGIVLMFSLILPLSASAQQYLGSISGSVSDASGAKVVGADVTATDTTTHFVSRGVTNNSGDYTIPSLTPDVYSITVTAKGFRTETRTGITLTAGATVGSDFALTVGTQTETVIVTENSQMLDTESPALSTTIPNQEVTDLPNNGRDPNVLATLTVGVMNGGSGGYFQGQSHAYTNPFSGVAIQINSSGNAGHNRLTLDGIPNDPPERLSGTTYAGFTPSPESVQEVKVSTSIFDAQVGHGNGTVTDVILKSGGNKFHGAAYYAFQNTYLDANLSQNKHTTPPTSRPNNQVSQTGFVFDGPVLIPHVYDGHDKTHFLVAYERYHSHTTVNYSSRMPTAAELTGDFSGLCNTFNSSGFCTSGVQLYMPNSTLDANNNRTQFFPNNNIASAISSSGAAFASYYPGQNVTGATAQSTVSYISRQTAYPSNYPSFDIRVDHQISANDTINATFFTAGLTQNYPLQGFPKGIGPNGYGYTVIRNTHGGSLDEVHVFSPSFVLDSRLGLINHPFGLVYPGNANFNLSSLGVSGSYPYDSFPGVSFSNGGYASLAPGAGGQVSTSTLGSLDEIVTATVKTHSIRFGFEGNVLRYNQQNPESGFGSGSGTPGFTFDNRFTQQNVTTTSVGADPNSGDAFADLMLGDFSSDDYTINPSYAMQQIYYAPWVQDDWRVNHKLTLNLGLRWDVELPYTERFNKLVTTFCTTCVNPLQASVPGVPLYGGLQFTSSSNRYPFPANYKAIQPRLGLAYQVDNHTVIRAGYGLIYFNTFESPIATGYSSATGGNNFVSNYTALNPLSNPYPLGIALPTGSSLGLGTALGQSVSFVDPSHVQPRDSQFTLNVQRQFPGSLVVQAAYVGARPTHLEVNHNINILPANVYNLGAAEVTTLTTPVTNPLHGLVPSDSNANGATIQPQYLDLPYPEFQSVTEDYSPIGSAPYNALQVTVTKPMTHSFTIAGNLTWQKIMDHTAYLDNYAAAIGRLEHVWDQTPSFFGTIYGTYELPKFDSMPFYGREILGGWKLNGVMRFSNGQLLNAPSNVNIIGNYKQPNWSLLRQFNTCYENTAGTPQPTVPNSANGGATNTITACDSQSPTPAFQQRLSFTSQTNSPYLNIRQQYYPLLDASLFKQFAIREGVNFEIRGEFFNILNTPIWGGPSTTLGAANAGSSSSAATSAGFFSQANDPRYGQLTARINF